MNQTTNQVTKSIQVKSVEELGKYVRAYRKARGITQGKVSGLSNVSTKFLSEFERGKKTSEIGKILQVLNVLGIDVTVGQRKSGIKG